jgi:translation initiation factor 2B subunit (eIF-2B alpha/beta/delta family)/8-oxo-dGTP pyrophosphatase MutT (NUDIX family)
LENKQVVTAFLRADQKILLLRRSAKVGTYQGRWAAVSGYLEAGEDPLLRARTEIQEEVGLNSEKVSLVRSGGPLRAFDEEADIVWVVHPFLFEVQPQNIRLDWEHTEHRWVDPDDLGSYETVPKLKETFDRVRWDLQTIPVALANVLRRVDDLAQDRLHGASLLGRQAIELLAEVASASEANSVEELFRDILLVASRLRKAQQGMATIGNLVGKLLREVELKRKSSGSVQEFRKLVRSLPEQAIAHATGASEDASRNSVAILPEEGRVLTHSYSSTVKRALELGMKSGRSLRVYVTESHPGLEGKQLAKDLVALGLTVRLIADSAATSIISDVDLVLVGADSVLTDGSLINKVGTEKIAAAANAQNIPFYVICETAKFSTLDFLGESVEFSKSLFDVTTSKHVTEFITEMGHLKSSRVEHEIRRMLRELYP